MNGKHTRPMKTVPSTSLLKNPVVSRDPGGLVARVEGVCLPSRDTGRRKLARLCNWLKALDEAAKTLPRATDWLGQYGPFMLARYPNLRPQPVPGDAHSRIMCESGER